jgi:serine/threonine protein kinase
MRYAQRGGYTPAEQQRRERLRLEAAERFARGDDQHRHPQFRMRFGREVAAARRVSGMYTAMVVDADVDGPVPWLATAYVPGPSLSEAVDNHGPFPVGSLLALAAGLAESLTAIHAAGVVHRDLKPSNVMLAEDGPRVIDFGISRAVESTALTQAGLVIGSPGFMSPEQAMGQDVGPPSDIFNLGAVLAFAAAGVGPFGTGTTVALLYRVVHGSPSLDQVPADVRPLIERCLAKDPGQRPTADGLLAQVGALQPTGNWLPESIIRAFARDAAPGPAPAASDAVLGSSGALGYGGALGSSAAASSAAQGTTGESQLLAPAGNSLTAPSKSMPLLPGGTPPPGGAHPQPPPGGRNRPRRRSWRPLVLAWIIGGLIGASAAAAFAVTAFTGHTPTPVQSQAALTSSPTAPASAGRTDSSVPVSRQASASPTASSFQGTSQPASASASPSVHSSRSPTASASPSPSASPTPSPSSSASASTSPSSPTSSSPPASTTSTSPSASA